MRTIHPRNQARRRGHLLGQLPGVPLACQEQEEEVSKSKPTIFDLLSESTKAIRAERNDEIVRCMICNLSIPLGPGAAQRYFTHYRSEHC